MEKVINSYETLFIVDVTGGEEAALFAADLFRMYERYAAFRGWRFEVQEKNETGLGGVKEAVASISGNAVFASLKYESGAHRVQRVPVTESNGRMQTSAATVAVLPEADPFEVNINEGEIKWDTFRSSGAGGQNVNKVETAVRLRYIPENIIIECRQTRSQLQNREKAMQMLKSRLYEMELRKKKERLAEAEAGKRKIEWGSQIRNYVLQPYKLVKDVRTGVETADTAGVLDGDLDNFIKSFLLMPD